MNMSNPYIFATDITPKRLIVISAITFSFSLNVKQAEPRYGKVLPQTLQQQVIESLLVGGSFHLCAVRLELILHFFLQLVEPVFINNGEHGIVEHSLKT